MSVKAVKYGEPMLRFFIFALFLFILGCTGSQNEINESINESIIVPKPTTNMTYINTTNESVFNNSFVNNSNATPVVINNSLIKNPKLVQVYYYYSSTCPFCNAITPHINELAKQYENTTEWHRFNVLVAEDLAEYNGMALRFNLTLPNERVVPIIVIKDKKLTNMFEINRSLTSLLENETAHLT